MKKILLLLLTFFYSAVAQAEFYRGNDLKRLCAGTSHVQDGICMGYVAGIYDTLIASRYICSFDGVTVGQLQEIVKKYINENPEKLHFPAQFLVGSALRNVFSCSKK